MFEIRGSKFSCCDGLSRRSFLRVGALGLGGLTLPQVLSARSRAAERTGKSSSPKAVIYLELAGGPSHFETYDPKPHAPAEYRGPLDTVATKLPGVRFSQFLRRQAAVMDKLVVIRSIQHDSGSHQTSSHLTQTGYYLRDRQNRDNEMPCFGSIAARVLGANAQGLPAFVSIPRLMRYGSAAFLGKGYNPLETVGDPNKANFEVKNLELAGKLTMDRLEDRRHLLASLDGTARLVDNRGVADAVDHFTREAFELVTGPRAREAFNIQAEDDRVRDLYGRNTTGQSLLLARRLVEAGVTCVSVRVGGWDDHVKMVNRIKTRVPDYDRGLAALVSDLYDRGLDRDVLVVAMGEFGRTPRVNRNAGRDHWGSVMSVLLSGGGLPVGQVIGASSSRGEVPQESPYRPENVLAMVYRHLGIDPDMQFTDLSGRPRYVLERRELIEELI